MRNFVLTHLVLLAVLTSSLTAKVGVNAHSFAHNSHTTHTCCSNKEEKYSSSKDYKSCCKKNTSEKHHKSSCSKEKGNCNGTCECCFEVTQHFFIHNEAPSIILASFSYQYFYQNDKILSSFENQFFHPPAVI